MMMVDAMNRVDHQCACHGKRSFLRCSLEDSMESLVHTLLRTTSDASEFAQLHPLPSFARLVLQMSNGTGTSSPAGED